VLDAIIKKPASAFAPRGSGSDPASSQSGAERPAPSPPAPPRLPSPKNPWAPLNVAPGGAAGGASGGSGGSVVGVLAALIALLGFAPRLGGVLPINVAPLRPPALAFHLKRPG
jgi:hypothetical protein